MGYNEVMHIEIDCDYPGCDEYLIFGCEGWERIKKMMQAIGWTHISFPGEEKGRSESLYFCAECKKKDPGSIKKHDCVFIRMTKKGKPSDYGTILECYFCGRHPRLKKNLK